MRSISLAFLLLLTNTVTASPVSRLGESTKLRFSWREFTAERPGVYAARVSIKICAGAEGEDRISCVPLGEFASVRLDTNGAKTVEVRQSTPQYDGVAVNRLIDQVTANYDRPVVRISLELDASGADAGPTRVAREFVPLPDETGNQKVILKGGGYRSRVLVQFEKD